MFLYVSMPYSDLCGFIESVDPVHKILLVIGLQEELPHPGIDDYLITKNSNGRRYIIDSPDLLYTGSESSHNTNAVQTLCYIKYDDVCVCQENRSTTTDVSRREKKQSLGHFSTLLAALSLDDEQARSSCRSLLPSTDF